MNKKIVLALASLGCASVGVQQEQQHGPLDVYNKIELEGNSVFVSRQVSNNLSYLYEGLERELPVCMFGGKTDQGYFVRSVGFPFYIYSDSVSSGFNISDCVDSDDFLGLVHNHPKGGCDPSYVDMMRFLRDESSVLEMVVCGTDRDVEMVSVGVVRKEDFVRGER